MFSGFILFYLRDASVIYFESALIAFLSLFMITIFALSNQYSMLGRIDYPHFYWAVFSAPLILFSRVRVVSFIWALLFFVTLIYWLPEQEWLENNTSLIEIRALLIYLMPSLLGLIYLGTKLAQVHILIQKSIQGLLFLSVLICFLLIYFNNVISLHALLPLGHFQIYVILLYIATTVVIRFLKNQSFKQKTFLVLAIISVVCAMLLKTIAPTGIELQGVILILGLINLLLFYASNQFFWTADALAIVCSFLLSISLSLYFYSSYMLISFINTGLTIVLFILFTALYFLILRARIK